MTAYLILTPEIADAVREPLAATAPIYVPIEREGAQFVLPVSVLSVEAHADTWPALASCPQMEPDDPDFPPAIESEP